MEYPCLSKLNIPPHPGPTVIAQQYEANIGMVLIYGAIISIPGWSCDSINARNRGGPCFNGVGDWCW
ncbi:GntT/GntP/DsdX family permease [Bacillus sp. SD088]|uniref:GntT/GntP/DsdX family permease n=1 Tax=Bacillus sp. SD088 TaxID=2782012 RepID=UPI0037BE9EED